jgi:hypothetical protein
MENDQWKIFPFNIREFNLEVQHSTNLPLPLGEGRGEGLRANTFCSLVGSVNKAPVAHSSCRTNPEGEG